MNEIKKKRYPTDRIKLHALLNRRERVLAQMTADVEELRRLTRAADHAAINSAADEFQITPEEFMAFIQARNHGEAHPGVTTLLCQEADREASMSEKMEDVTDEGV